MNTYRILKNRLNDFVSKYPLEVSDFNITNIVHDDGNTYLYSHFEIDNWRVIFWISSVDDDKFTLLKIVNYLYNQEAVYEESVNKRNNTVFKNVTNALRYEPSNIFNIISKVIGLSYTKEGNFVMLNDSQYKVKNDNNQTISIND